MRIQRVSDRILTIGKPGLSVISPRGGAIPWYLAGGVSAANCIAAYQPIGADDYADSKINIANPGTYNAADGAVYPTWNASDGWVYAGGISAAILTVAYEFSDGDNTVIVRLTCGGSGGGTYGKVWESNADKCGVIPNRAGTVNSEWKNGGTALIVNNTDFRSGVLAHAGTDAYVDGSDVGNITFTSLSAGNFAIGNRTSDKARCLDGTIQALSIYNTTLTGDQVAAITTAMNAL